MPAGAEHLEQLAEHLEQPTEHLEHPTEHLERPTIEADESDAVQGLPDLKGLVRSDPAIGGQARSTEAKRTP